MKSLLIMRHAKSSWKKGDLPDHDRPLNKRGKRDAPKMGALLRREELVPDVILCSSAVRARATAAAVMDASGFGGPSKFRRSLYAAAPGDYLRLLRGLADRHARALVLGHNPGLEELLEMLTGEEERLPTAAVAHVRLNIERWAALGDYGDGELLALWRPRELG